MPTHPLPRHLVKRVHNLIIKEQHNKKTSPERIPKFLSTLKNIDHRRFKSGKYSKDIHCWGGRIRSINVKRNYPQVGELVLKYSHDNTAREVVDMIGKEVKACIKKNPRTFNICKPYVYPVSTNIIAMAKTNYPSIEEAIQLFSDTPPTQRGRKFISNLAKENKKKIKEIESELKIAVDELERKTHLYPGNILVTGYAKGKFMFMPLADMW
jgi:hypothetical protein